MVTKVIKMIKAWYNKRKGTGGGYPPAPILVSVNDTTDSMVILGDLPGGIDSFPPAPVLIGVNDQSDTMTVLGSLPAAPITPSVWLKEAVGVWNATKKSIDVTWELVAENNPVGISVSVIHSSEADGVPTLYPWEVPANTGSIKVTYSYLADRVKHLDVLSFRILENESVYAVSKVAPRLSYTEVLVQPLLPVVPSVQYRAKTIPDKASLTFEGPLTLSAASFSGTEPLVISGRNFRQTNKLSAGIYGRNIGNDRKVIIENNHLDSSGRGIDFLYTNVDIVVRNNIFYPNGACDKDLGSWALALSNPKRVVFENNYMVGVSGMLVEVTANDILTGGITHRYNKYHNIAGNTGAGTSPAIANYAKLFFQNGAKVPNMLFEWDEITTDESNVSKVEDMFSYIYAQGTEESPCILRDTCIYKAYPHPFNETVNDNWTGSGILIESPDQPDKTKCAGHIKVYNLRLIGMGKGSIALMTAHDTEIYNNRVIFSRRFLDNSVRPMYTTGIGARNYYGIDGTTYNNQIHDNYIKFASGGDGGTAIDMWTPTDGINTDASNPAYNGTQEVTWGANTVDAAQATLADEAAEWEDWLQDKAEAGVICGPKELV